MATVRAARPAARRTTTAAKTEKKAPAKKAVAKNRAGRPEGKKDTFATGAKKKAPVQTEVAAAAKAALTYPADRNTPPAITGTVRRVDGTLRLESHAGQFSIANRADPAVDENHMFSGVDLAAFEGRTVTVRGWPTDPNWKRGDVTTLAVEEFAPGISPNFVAGRVDTTGDKLVISVRADKKIIVDDAKLKAALEPFDLLGVVLPGTVTKKGNEWHLTTAPKDYYILAGFSWGGAPDDGTGTKIGFNMQLAHGKSIEGELPRTDYNNTQRDSRHYFFGHFADGKFLAKGVTPGAGGWTSMGEQTTRVPEFEKFIASRGPSPLTGNFGT